MSNTIYKYIIALTFAIIPLIACHAQFKMEPILALEDSELVFSCGVRAELKKGSKLLYPSHSSGQNVTLILTGEASFQVLTGFHLTVEYNEIIVKATAAGFSITEWKGTIEVTSLKGEITILANKQEIVIRQFQRAVYDVSAKQISIIDTKMKRA